MARAPTAEDFAKGLREVQANITEYQENVKSPLVSLGASVVVAPVLTLPFWSVDVVKNHIMAGKDITLGIKRKFSRKGLGFGLLGASVLGVDISNRYIQQYGHEFSFSKKAMIGLAPLSLIPIASSLECLKINAQISQTSMKQSFQNLTQTAGYRALFRGIVPYSSLFLLTYCSLSLPVYYSQKPGQNRVEEMEQVTLNPLIVLSSLLIATPIDILKTKAMLGEKISLQSLKMCPRQLGGIFLLRTAYVAAFGGFVDFFTRAVEGIMYLQKIQVYQEKKKSKYFAKDDEFDGFIPSSLDGITSDREFTERVLMK